MNSIFDRASECFLNGDYNAAAEYFSNFCSEHPNNLESHSNAGVSFFRAGNFVLAEFHFNRALELDPYNPVTLSNYGQFLLDQDQILKAFKYCEIAVKLNPNSAASQNNFANCLVELEKFGEAEEHYQKATDLDPKLGVAWTGLGLVKNKNGDVAPALELFDKAIQLNPDDPLPYCHRAKVLIELGSIEEAKEVLHNVVKIRPRQTAAWEMLAELQRGDMPESDIEEMKKLVLSGITSRKQSQLYFGLGHVHSGIGKHELAAEYWMSANALVKQHRKNCGLEYDPVEFERFVDQLIFRFTPEVVKTLKIFGDCNSKPIFIVGMPRSGTTLVEQILSSHPATYGAGELTSIREAFSRFTENVKPEELIHSEKNKIFNAATYYLSTVQSDKISIDKMPDNYLFLGFIKILFPNCKIIHVKRDPRDTALSCWATDFGTIRWANDVNHISHRFQQYKKIMKHWSSFLDFQTIEYEKLATEKESSIKNLVSVAGLDWNDSCLTPHKTSRAVRTSSASQVRKPIYTSSINKWQNYKSWLNDMFVKVS